MPPSKGHNPARILDANGNRAREALRVLEDAARFLLDDGIATDVLKHLRHELVAILEALPGDLLLGSRATDEDEGRNITTPGEMQRADAAAVARAAAGRLSESLRSLEEWVKTIDPSLARGIESIRYRSYETTGIIIQKLSKPPAQWRLAVLVTESSCRLPWEEVLRAAIDGGADCIQIREKQIPDEALLRLVEEAVAIARPCNVSVIVNDRVDIALAAGADGVHIGANDLPLDVVRSIAAGRLLVGCSIHDLGQAKSAIEGGCDYCGVGTMYPSSTKVELEATGPALLASFIKQHPDVPHLAIGGIDATRAGELGRVGCRGLAVSSAICSADDPAGVARDIINQLGVASPEEQSVPR